MTTGGRGHKSPSGHQYLVRCPAWRDVSSHAAPTSRAAILSPQKTSWKACAGSLCLVRRQEIPDAGCKRCKEVVGRAGGCVSAVELVGTRPAHIDWHFKTPILALPLSLTHSLSSSVCMCERERMGGGVRVCVCDPSSWPTPWAQT